MKECSLHAEIHAVADSKVDNQLIDVVEFKAEEKPVELISDLPHDESCDEGPVADSSLTTAGGKDPNEDIEAATLRVQLRQLQNEIADFETGRSAMEDKVAKSESII